NQQRQNHRVESKRENAVEQSDAAHAARGDLHVRHLTGHADHKRKISKIKVIRRPITWENQSAGMPIHARLVAITVKRMRIPQTITRMNQGPRKDQGQQREQQMNDEMTAALTPFHADEKSDCEQSSGCGDHDKKKNQEAAEILLLR